MTQTNEGAPHAGGNAPVHPIELESQQSPSSRELHKGQETAGADRNKYPYIPGYRSNSTGNTAEQASISVARYAKTLEQHCQDHLVNGPRTPEEIRVLIERDLDRPVLLNSVRPRLSALKARGLVADSGERGVSEGGRCKAIRWQLTTDVERAMFNAAKALADEKGPDQ